MSLPLWRCPKCKKELSALGTQAWCHGKRQDEAVRQHKTIRMKKVRD